jgi:hypothetical protein
MTCTTAYAIYGEVGSPKIGIRWRLLKAGLTSAQPTGAKADKFGIYLNRADLSAQNPAQDAA